MVYLDKGTQIHRDRDTLKKYIGKYICYVTTRDVDRNRGFVFPRFGTIESIRYSTLYFDNGNQIDIRDLLEVSVLD